MKTPWRRAAVAAMLAGGIFICGCKTQPTAASSEKPRLQSPQSELQNQPPDDDSRIVMSLLGTPLLPVGIPVDVRAQREERLQQAQAEYDRDPHNEEAIIWVGRRLAYLGRYSDAIDIFSNGLAIHPESYKLLRHRGHRYITVRKFDLAHADLSKAASLIEARQIPDEIEADGQPNKQGIPTSTSHTNIYYHLGLVQYLQGDYSAAIESCRKCMNFSKNDDMRVATAYWLYLALRRSGDEHGANLALAGITREMNIIENASYYQLLLMFKGDISEAHAAGESSLDATVDDATIGYGLGVHALLKEDHQTAREHFERVINTTNWAAFGHIAAEVEADKILRSMVK